MLWQFGPDTRIVIGAGAARQTERAAAYLQAQIERRCGWRWQVARGGEAGPGTIALGIPGDGSPAGPLLPEHPEEIALCSGGDPNAPSAVALAGGPTVVLAAAGKLARSFDLRLGRAGLPSLSLRERAAFPVRGHTLANHKQNTTYDKWAWEQWEEHLTELAAWGNNIAVLYPLHVGRWPGVLPFDTPAWFATPDREDEFARQLDIQLRLPVLCHELGMRYGIWMPPNDVFPEEVVRHPEITRHGRAYVCPHRPAARQRIHAIRDRLFALLPHLDVLFIPSKDDGGCPGCPDCNPWAPTYLELVQEHAALARNYHPECQIWLAQQGLTGPETRFLLDWLDRVHPDWVEGVAFGPYSELMTFGDAEGAGGALSLERYPRSGRISGPLNRLRAALPGRYRMILYPDETHTFRCQYPVVGMDPVVQFVWDRENGPAPRPREMARLHAETCAADDGAVPYTEGDTDDVNKFVWSARDWNPSRSGEEIAAEYARWFFGSVHADAATRIILSVEDILNGPLYGNPAVAEARALANSHEADDPGLLDNWRWLNLRLGVAMLSYVQRVLVRDREVAAELRYRAAVWHHDPEPSASVRETVHHLERRFAETGGLLDEIVWTRDRLFTLHKLAVRGVPRLQNSYLKLDVLLERWKEALARLERGELTDYAEKHAALIGPLREAEDSVRMGVRGVQLVEHIREYTWESGATTWVW